MSKKNKGYYPHLLSLLKIIDQRKKDRWHHYEDELYREHFSGLLSHMTSYYVLNGKASSVHIDVVNFPDLVEEVRFSADASALLASVFLHARPTDMVKLAYKDFTALLEKECPNGIDFPIRTLLDNRLLGINWFLTPQDLAFWNHHKSLLRSNELTQYEEWTISQGDHIDDEKGIIRLMQSWKNKTSGPESLMIAGLRRQRHKEKWIQTAFRVYGIGTFVDQNYTGNRFSLRVNHLSWMSKSQKTYLKKCNFIPALRDKGRWKEWHDALCDSFDRSTFDFYDKASAYYSMSDMKFAKEYTSAKVQIELLGLTPDDYFAQEETLAVQDDLVIHF